MINIYGIQIPDNIDDEIFHTLLQYVSTEKGERLNTYTITKDAYASLFADLIVRKIIIEEFKLNNDEIIIKYGEFGKPYFENYRNFIFNVSHSGDWVVCICHNSPVGIDIEKIRPTNFKIAKRFFSEEEYYDLLMTPLAKRLEYYYDLWTSKESFIKTVEKGLIIPLDSFTVKINQDSISVFHNISNVTYYFKQYTISNEYKLTACATVNTFPSKVKLVSFTSLFSSFC